MNCESLAFVHRRQKRKEKRQQRRLQRQNLQEEDGGGADWSARKRPRREATPSSLRLVVDCGFDDLMLIKVSREVVCEEPTRSSR